MTNKTPKESAFWTDKWENNDIPWDKKGSHPLLQHLVSQQNLFLNSEKLSQQENEKLKEKLSEDAKNLRVAMVPGCGSGYDVATVSGFNAVKEAIGVDLSPIAMEKATKAYENQVQPKGKLLFKAADFFKLHEEYAGKVDMMIEYTFLCALHPTMRKDWAKAMSQLIRPGGYLVHFVFPIKPYRSDPESPPFNYTVEEVKELLGDNFELVLNVETPDQFCHEERREFERYALWRRR